MKQQYTNSKLNMMMCEQTVSLTPSLSESIPRTCNIRLGTPHTNSDGNGTDGSTRHHQTPPTTGPRNPTTPGSSASLPPRRAAQPSVHGSIPGGVERDQVSVSTC